MGPQGDAEFEGVPWQLNMQTMLDRKEFQSYVHFHVASLT